MFYHFYRNFIINKIIKVQSSISWESKILFQVQSRLRDIYCFSPFV